MGWERITKGAAKESSTNHALSDCLSPRRSFSWHDVHVPSHTSLTAKFCTPPSALNNIQIPRTPSPVLSTQIDILDHRL